MKTILVIDDDAYINDLVEKALVSEGYEVMKAYSGTEALLLLGEKRPDLILLDLMLPGITGEELLPKIKDIPVIVVSAKMDLKNKVELLTNGAADYITKPFEIDELKARVLVQMRNIEHKPKQDESIVCGDFTLDPLKLIVKSSRGEVKLTRTESAILKILMMSEGKPIGRNDLLEMISGDTPDCTERSLKQHISNTRKKLQSLDGIDHIDTIYGIGFRFKS
ncbi:MAG: response regulator transcription factor [Clostridiales bacterium]|nr:response regulator transcription factor [Clostridiales bacterium]